MTNEQGRSVISAADRLFILAREQLFDRGATTRSGVVGRVVGAERAEDGDYLFLIAGGVDRLRVPAGQVRLGPPIGSS